MTPPSQCADKRGTDASVSASASGASVGRARRGRRRHLAHIDHPLSEAEVAAIDAAFARFVFAEGLPLNTVRSTSLRALTHKLHSGWLPGEAAGHRPERAARPLTVEFESVFEHVQDAIEAALALTLVTGGWSGLQRKRSVDIILSVGDAALFVANVFADDNSVAGDDQC